MEIQAAAATYHKYLTVTRKLSQNMISGTMGQVGNLADHLIDNGIADTKEITADIVSTFTEAAYGQIGGGTYNNYVGYLRRWLQWMSEEDLLGADRAPWRKLISQTRPQPVRPKRCFTEEDIKLLAAAGADWHPRDEYYIRCSYWMTRRKIEVCTLKVGDIDFSARPDMPYGLYVFDDIKNRKYRVPVMISEELHELLQQWLKIYSDLIDRPLANDDYLFPALKKGRAKNVRGVRAPLIMRPKQHLPSGSTHFIWYRAIKIVNKEGKRFESVGWNSHAARRGGASDLLTALREAGVEDAVRVVQYQLNHADERMTEVYVDDRRETHSHAKAMAKLAAHRGGETAPLPEVEQQPAGVADLAAFRSRRLVRGTA